MLFDERPIERKRKARKKSKIPNSHSNYFSIFKSKNLKRSLKRDYFMITHSNLLENRIESQSDIEDVTDEAFKTMI